MDTLIKRGLHTGDFPCACGAHARVLATRLRPGGIVYRRHECVRGHRFSTVQANARRKAGKLIAEQIAA